MNRPVLSYGLLRGQRAFTEWLVALRLAEMRQTHAEFSEALGTDQADRFVRWKVEQLRASSSAGSFALFGGSV